MATRIELQHPLDGATSVFDSIQMLDQNIGARTWALGSDHPRCYLSRSQILAE